VFGSGGHDTRYFNPSYSSAKLERLKRRKPFVYETEHLAEFKKSQGMFDPLIIDGLVNHNRELELPPREGIDYWAFTDTAGGSGKDSYALSIGHVEDGRVIIDLVRSQPPPFDPDAQTKTYCELLRRYRVNRIQGDRFSGDWCARSHQRHGVYYEKCERPKNEIYLECESPVNCGLVELPPMDSLVHQLKLLVRTPRSGTKDKVDTAGGQPEDEANVCCGVIWLLLNQQFEKALPISFGIAEKPETESMESYMIDLLLDRPQRKTRPGEVNDEKIMAELREIDREIEAENSDQSKARILKWK